MPRTRGATRSWRDGREHVNDVSRFPWLEWVVTSGVVLSIGMDPSVAIWRVSGSAVPPEFRTISLSASDVTLSFFVLYLFATRRSTPAGRKSRRHQAITLSGSILVGSLVVTTFAAGVPELSAARAGEVVLGLLVCLLLASRPSVVRRLLISGFGLILLQLPQLIVQEVTQTSRSLGSWIPGWPPTTPASVSGALVVFGPGDLRWQRGMGSFLHPNLLGGFLAIWIVLSLPLLARRGTGGLTYRITWWAAWAELLLTFSRAALLAAVVGCIWWEFASGRHSQHVRRIRVVWGVPAVATVVFSIALRQIVIPRLDPIAVLHSVAATDRLELLRVAVRLMSAHPFLGVGAGNYSIAEARLPLAATQVQPVHVVPLLVAAESGIAAGLAWLALVTLVPIIDWRDPGIRSTRGTQRFAVPVVLLILASLDHYFWTFAPGQALFWVTLGIWASRSDVEPVPEIDESSEYLGDLIDSSHGEREALLTNHGNRRHDER